MDRRDDRQLLIVTESHFDSQLGRGYFDRREFRSLLRARGCIDFGKQGITVSDRGDHPPR